MRRREFGTEVKSEKGNGVKKKKNIWRSNKSACTLDPTGASYASTDLLSWLGPFAGEHNTVGKKRII